MVMRRIALTAAFWSGLAASAGACLPGWDCCKWADPKHQTPKYVVGRIIAPFPATPAGLERALPIINAFYPGTRILPGKGDKVRIPCVGVVDLVIAAGEGGKGWWWGADAKANECRSCTPNRCEQVSKSIKCGGSEGRGAGAAAGTGAGIGQAGSGFAGAASNCAGVKVPNRLAVLERTARDDPDAWAAKLNPNEMEECRPDSRYIDAVVDNLRREDQRWGFNCKRGNCNDPSHDVIAYYFGQGKPYEGAPQVMLVDMIQNTCAPDARPNWLVLEADFGNGSGAGWTSKGRFPSGPRQDVVMNCPRRGGGAPTASVAPLGGPGGSSAPAPRSASPRPPRSDAPQALGGPRGGAPAALEGPGAAEPPPVPSEPAPAVQEEEEPEE